MVGVRIAFDTSLSVVASTRITAGGRTFEDGAALPWRELGISEDLLRTWWRCALVAFQPAESAQPVSASPPPIVAPTKPPQRSRAAK